MASSPQTRISVALCTYNGERFLPQQLASIQRQTRLPDELVVCDDRSTDRTVEIVHEFAASVSFPVKIVENEQTLGSSKNFEKAIRLCSGDLIALSDQDDAWCPIRLERSEQELLMHPGAGLVFSDGDLIDDQDHSLGTRLWRSFSFTRQRAGELLAGNYDLLLKYRFVTGATVMFRATLRDRCLPIPQGWIHDEWIAAIAAAFSDLRPIEEALICYRQHTLQQLGSPSEVIPRGKLRDVWDTLAAGEKTERYWTQLSRDIRFARIVCSTLSGMSLDERGRRVLGSYEAWLRFATFRSNLPGRRLSRLVPLAANYSCYSKHALGLKSAVKDLVRSKPQ